MGHNSYLLFEQFVRDHQLSEQLKALFAMVKISRILNWQVFSLNFVGKHPGYFFFLLLLLHCSVNTYFKPTYKLSTRVWISLNYYFLNGHLNLVNRFGTLAPVNKERANLVLAQCMKMRIEFGLF